MAQIFVSHSKNDKEIIHLFLEAFAGTDVKPHLEELEAEPPTGVNAEKIKKDIDSSNAVFVLLSESVESLKHTRDWINWECGVARNKPIWVFEPAASLGRVSVVVPTFAHYAAFDMSDEWRKYLRMVIASLDHSHVLSALGLSAGAGAIFNDKDPKTGALIGAGVGLAGLIVYNLTRPSLGTEVTCLKCNSKYRVHHFGNFRCAVCNTLMQLQQPQPQAIGASAT